MTLPTELIYQGDNSLLGWSTDLEPEFDEDTSDEFAAALYTDSYKASSCVYSSPQGDLGTTLTLQVPTGTLPLCRLFFLGSGFAPFDTPLTVSLKDLK